MKSVALYIAIICLIRSIDAIDSALLVLSDGTTSFLKFSSEWTTSPNKMMNPEFFSRTSRDWCPGVCPGVKTKLVLSPPNTSVSPSIS
jgi:hypothetical protein